ncbi:HpcH/HpaI aldolase family protein [Natronincola ferrireducens]|uniref:2-dehydro-3-deoxyglucarate aldolase n=1 Tax=Natronincola ferrireducens TaxID=393762 RepID=A0A1G9GE52_9FIRM|nr:aldolase/citrate lyase family protein [Natronincola ferrireducens]SDK98978.1 2-dehydro-3-deoxyglucarate aldolase [Natronincola ferrireducens]
MLQLNEVFDNKVKWMLKDKKKTIGAWLQIGSPFTSEIFAKAGFDWLMIDMEHGPGDIMTLISQLQAMSKYGTVPLVRAPWNDFVAIKKILDAGVYGILVPYVNNKKEAEAAVAACRYPTMGVRGVAPSPRAGGFGMNSANYLENANNEIMVMVAIETPEAVENIEEIVQVENLDGIFIGPMDLATSMGSFCNPNSQEVKEAISKVEKAVLKTDKFLGTVAGNIEQATVLYEKGYSFVVTMSDSTTLGKLAINTVKQFREQYSSR